MHCQLDRRYSISITISCKKQLPLFCVPILLKDNIDTYDMPTTAGSKSMVNCTSTKDAFVVDKLRSAGAVILGKVGPM